MVSPTAVVPSVVSKGIPRTRLGEEEVTVILVDGKAYFHINEVLHCLEVPSSKRRIRNLKEAGSLVIVDGVEAVDAS